MVEELRIIEKQTLFDTTDLYVIPRYQRAYAWEDKEIIQLIDDINGINESGNYFIGSLVVSKQNDKNIYEVVDGQQRLTTLYLLLQYLASEGALNHVIQPTLSFDCRPNSNYTLRDIRRIIKHISEKTDSVDEDKIEHSIFNGIKIITQKFSSDNIDKEQFVARLRQVILYRIEVPENTDLNRYFEIMNTRGEQLEQHDILKARLMGNIKDRSEQELFSRIWDACSDMTGYVQMHFDSKDREVIFGSEWNNMPDDEWENYKSCIGKSNESTLALKISDITTSEFQINNVDGFNEDDKHIRFESIIDFPYFLLHSLRVFVEFYDVKLKKQFGDLLDDKKLIADFETVIDNGLLDGNAIKKDKEKFSKMFIIHLLQTRFLFDKFIIKREFTSENNEGEWSLKELLTSGQQSKKKAYFVNTKFSYSYEREKTYAVRNTECLMIQAALRVSYTSPKVMHWITNLLLWLSDMTATEEYQDLKDEAENIARQATFNNFLNNNDFKLGVQTPHIVFNYLDFLLWKQNKDEYRDFEFEFRNSVEHWYPQNPSDSSFDSWNDKDTFGNLCLLSRSVNSKFSNLSPESKMKSYSKIVNRGSLKLRIMGQIIQSSSNEEWVNSECYKHEERMLSILKEACESSL